MNNNRVRGLASLHNVGLLLTVVTCFWLIHFIWEASGRELISLPWSYALAAVLGVFLASFGSIDSYDSFLRFIRWRRFGGSVIKANFQVSLIAFLVFAFYFATKDKATSRLFLAAFIGVCWPVLVLANFSLPVIFKRFILPLSRDRKSVIIGDGEALDSLSQWLERHTAQGFSFDGVFSTSRCIPEKLSLPDLGHYSMLDKYLQNNEIHQVVVVPDEHIDRWIPLVAENSNRHGCRVLIYNSLSSLFDSRLVFVEESGRQFFKLQNEPLESAFNRMVKRVFDIALSIPALLLVLPLAMIFVWLFQRIQSSGPLFFRQERVGLAGRKFVIWKFRSMGHVPSSDMDEAAQATRSDKRIFPAGRFIRRFSIDEIPQFLNVLIGEMSLVGPRPYLAQHDYLFQRDYKAYRVRQFVKPGVTGPAQCRGLRGEFTDPELVRRRIEMDFDYVGNWTVWTDCEIVLRTVVQVIFPPRSAY
jgi:exopolysaccharide biosynthesis polyprenyl glycosylphosphotransferase